MTARQLRWIFASIAIALEVTSFVLFGALMLRRHQGEPLIEPDEVPVEAPTEAAEA